MKVICNHVGQVGCTKYSQCPHSVEHEEKVLSTSGTVCTKRRVCVCWRLGDYVQCEPVTPVKVMAICNHAGKPGCIASCPEARPHELDKTKCASMCDSVDAVVRCEPIEAERVIDHE